MHVLLVEDDRPTLRAYVVSLRDAGHTSTSCENVADALGRLDVEAFDLVLSDGHLPDGHSCQVMEVARSHHGLRGLIVSAFAEAADVARYRNAGFDETLGKPVPVDVVLEALARIGALPKVPAPLGTQWPSFPACVA